MRWLFIIHQLPPEPPYLRAKIRNRLARIGAVALKNSVYALPERDDCLEDLQWIAEEATSGGGEAFVCRVELVAGLADEDLLARFQRAATAAYATLSSEVEVGHLRRRLAECEAIDFFAAPGRKEAETMLRKLEKRPAGPRAGRSAVSRDAGLRGRTWVTRHGPKIDRLASAWLVRRRVDPKARIRFVDPERYRKRAGELSFDMVGGDFTHEGDRCTFETLLARLGLVEPALTAVAEIVHDLDLKDDKFGRPEVAGIGRLIDGLVAQRASDEARLEQGLALFDALHASLAQPAPPRAGRSAARPPRPSRRATRRRRRT